MRRVLVIAVVVLGIISQTILAKTLKKLTWEDLAQLEVETGKMPKSLSQHNNKTIEIAGFIVPLELEDSIDTVSEFLLVPDPLACIHVPPPPPNQMIFVTMEEAISLYMDERGVAITGTLKIHKPKPEDEGFVAYEIEGVSAKKADIDFEDPLMDLIMGEGH